MRDRVVIIGAGGLAKIVADIVERNNDKIVGFLDDNLKSFVLNKYKIIGKISDIERFKTKKYKYIIAIGNTEERERIANRNPNIEYYTAIHPSAIIANNVKIEEGSIVCAGAIINSNSIIKKHAIICSNVVIEHDAIIGSFVNIEVNATVLGEAVIMTKNIVKAGSIVERKQIINSKIDRSRDIEGKKINILITGKNSYIGENAKKYLEKYKEYCIEELDLLDETWKYVDFSKYDVIIHVAGIAHNSNSKKNAEMYYKVNRDLAISVAKKAKSEGVKQFIFMSSMIIFGGDNAIENIKTIDINTIPKAENAYGNSKLQADLEIQKLSEDSFKTVVIRCPMVFGANCKGNFAKLKIIAKLSPIFPDIENKRSMIYIENLCEFYRQAVENGYNGVYYPQNSEYVSTKDIIKLLAKEYGKKIHFIKSFNPIIKLFAKKIKLINKVFGSKIYTKELTGDFSYALVDNEKAIRESAKQKKKVLIICNMDIVLYNFREEIALELLEKGYEVYITFPYGDRVEYFTSRGCKFIETKVDRRGINPIADIKLLLSYNKLMKRIKPNVVLTYTIKPNIYGGLAARINKIPYIANITGLGSAMENKGIMQNIAIILYRIAFKNIRTVFFQNTENMQLFVDKKIALGKHKLIPGSGVNLEDFKTVEYPSEKDGLEFVFIGRVMKEKGIEQYIETAKAIKRKYPNTEFHILGFCEEEYEERLKALTTEGIVNYHGMQKDIRPFIKKTHCTIHPTYYPEGMSNVLLESSASARPIITTDRSGCREIVDEGINGFIVPIKDTKNLIQAVEKFIKLPYDKKVKMGLKGREKVENEFDRKIVVDAYMKEIDVKEDYKNE